jgi:hypothetical protein
MGTAFSIVLSILAFGFSIFVFTESRRRDRRDIFLKNTEYLAGDGIQRGRYVLFDKVIDESSIERLTDDEYRDVHRAVNAFNILGLYVKNSYVSERDVLDAWAIPVYRAHRAARPFMQFRERIHGYTSWPYFDALAQKCQEDLNSRGGTPIRPVEHIKNKLRPEAAIFEARNSGIIGPGAWWYQPAPER